MEKHSGHILSQADKQTRAQTTYKQGTAQFRKHKSKVVKEMFDHTFGVLAKAPADWSKDPSYFFTRRTEQGFKKDGSSVSPEYLASIFGQELFDIVYPKWWGGQGKVSDKVLTEKPFNRAYEPGSNFADEIMLKHSLFRAENQNRNLPENQNSHIKSKVKEEIHQEEAPAPQDRPHSHNRTTLRNKPQIKPEELYPAGRVTVRPQNFNTARPFDTSSYYGKNSSFNRWAIEANCDYNEHLQQTRREADPSYYSSTLKQPLANRNSFPKSDQEIDHNANIINSEIQDQNQYQQAEMRNPVEQTQWRERDVEIAERPVNSENSNHNRVQFTDEGREIVNGRNEKLVPNRLISNDYDHHVNQKGIVTRNEQIQGNPVNWNPSTSLASKSKMNQQLHRNETAADRK